MKTAEKKDIRQRMITMRDAMSVKERTTLSTRICSAIEALIHERNVRVLHSFLPMGTEVDLFPLLDRAFSNGIEIFSPRSMKGRVMENYRYGGQDKLVSGIFGTRHPAGNEPYTGTFDMILVPGLAFTENGDRLGYGAGYYDTFLPQHPNAFTVAVCFPFQVVDALPVEAHDRAVDLVETGTA